MTVRLYRHFDAAGALLYVGISICALRRTSQHMQTAKWSDRIRRIEIESFASREAALAAEKAAIIDERPAFNVIFNRAKTPVPTKRPPAPAAKVAFSPPRKVIEVRHREHVLDCDEIDELDEIDDDRQLALVWCCTHLKYESHYVPMDNVRHGGIIVRRAR